MTLIDFHSDRPVLIAGPTASGKSALALEIAQRQGGVIINADALQVFDGWRILTARPDNDDLSRARHALYGHIGFDSPYSTGQWLRELAPFLHQKERPIIVGGTGLNFAALTQGLADVPPTPKGIRAKADQLALETLANGLDPATVARIDMNNRARVQRAWEVQQATGRSLTDWQADTPAPLLALEDATAITLDVPVDWLNDRIARRFDLMLDQGAVREAREMLPHWDPRHQSSKAIGAPEMIAYLRGEIALETARERAIIASRQYAKRQRTWFRNKHRKWQHFDISSTDLSTALRFIP